VKAINYKEKIKEIGFVPGKNLDKMAKNDQKDKNELGIIQIRVSFRK